MMAWDDAKSVVDEITFKLIPSKTPTSPPLMLMVPIRRILSVLTNTLPILSCSSIVEIQTLAFRVSSVTVGSVRTCVPWLKIKLIVSLLFIPPSLTLPESTRSACVVGERGKVLFWTTNFRCDTAAQNIFIAETRMSSGLCCLKRRSPRSQGDIPTYQEARLAI